MKSGGVMMSKMAVVAFCALAVLLVASPALAGVAELVEKMPAPSPAEGDTINAAFVASGSAGVKAVCAMLVPPGTGDDTKARFALSGLAKYVSRNGAETERAMVAGAVLDALKMASDNEVKAFLIRQLQVAGRDECVPALSGYLADERLCGPATQTLTAIGTCAAKKALKTALPSLSGGPRIATMKAVGELRCMCMAPVIAPFATNDDPATRSVALFALANIGNPASEPVLAKACTTGSALEQAHAASLYLLYARQLAEGGDKKLGVAICRELLAESTVPNVRCEALGTLASITGKRVTRDLVAAMDDGCKEYRVAALRLAGVSPSKWTTRKWVRKMGKVGPPARLEIMGMLGERADSVAIRALLKALETTDDPAALAATATALRQLPLDARADAVAKALKKVMPNARAALLGVLRGSDAVAVLSKALSAAKSPEEKQVFLGDLATMRSEASLEAVVDAMADESIRAEAVATAVMIACPRGKDDPGLGGPVVAASLEKMLESATDEGARTKISAHLAAMPIPEEWNIARGKPVKTSVKHQGDKVPQKATDGNTDKNSAWFGAKWPSWLQVDLGYLATVNRAQVVFYYDEKRFYQYEVQVSADEKTWTTVADMSANDQPATQAGVLHSFDAIKARYVRVNVLKNSVNEAVHLVEVKVYEANASAALPTGSPADRDGFVSLFNGKDLSGWTGDVAGYVVENGEVVCKPGGNLYTAKQYKDFVFRFDFKLTPGANNGLGVRCPLPAHAAYQGMELQILDDTADKYKKLQPYQFHGSIYGVVPAKRGFLKPVGEWNSEEVIAKGRRITVILNGETIVDADLDEASTPKTLDGKDHPGLKRDKGHLAFCGHGDVLYFRNMRVKELK